MSSIIKQLVGKHVRILSDVRIFHDKHTRKSKPPNRDEWMALLQSITSCFHKTFIFVDALVIITVKLFLNRKLTNQGETHCRMNVMTIDEENFLVLSRH